MNVLLLPVLQLQTGEQCHDLRTADTGQRGQYGVRSDAPTCRVEKQTRGLGDRTRASRWTAAWSPASLVTPGERYEELMSRTQWWGRQMLIWGLHIHVGVRRREHVLSIVTGSNDPTPPPRRVRDRRRLTDAARCPAYPP